MTDTSPHGERDRPAERGALRPAGVMAPATRDDDLRVGHLLGSALAEDTPRAVLVGFPTDEGVRRNGGRPGAAQGPRAVREWLYRLTAGGDDAQPMQELLAATRDLGDVVTGDDLEHDQRTLASILAPHLANGTFVIVLGGGHETAFGHFLAHASVADTIRILNWDAHTDVRPPGESGAHSGSPFRQALEHPGTRVDYTAVGLQAHAVASAHAAWIRERGGRCIWRHEVSVDSIVPLYERVAPTMVSFDLDAVDQACAPGVSAPSTGGLTPAEWLAAAEAAGRAPSVRSCDIVELSPPLDRDGQTARLAALTVWRILRGLAGRR